MEEESIKSLKEFINLKFQAMEEKIEMKTQYSNEKIEDIEKKLERHSERIFNLEREKENKVKELPKSTWQKIQDAIINWAVPFVMMAILFYLSGGKK